MKNVLSSLQRYAKPRPIRERCELCSAELPEVHTHLVELRTRRLTCACEPCAILFGSAGAANYRRVPRTTTYLRNFQMDELEWQSLQLPINLAFFMSSGGRVVAFYPSPAGATEALPPQDAWSDLVAAHAELASLEPDVEALLVNRLPREPESYRTGVDTCYSLVGVVRMHWRGMTGGTKVWAEVERFFADLKERAVHA